MSSTKNALIVFPDEWISYSPTVLNAITILRETHEVTVFSVDNYSCKLSALPADHRRIRINHFISRVLSRLHLYRVFKFVSLSCSIGAHFFGNRSYDMVLGVDSIGYAAARLFYRNAVFLSLEIRRDWYFSLCKKLGVKQVVIQSEERRDYLFHDYPEKNLSVYFVQNAPLLEKSIDDFQLSFRKKNLIVLGNLLPEHGVEASIQALIQLGDEFILTLKGIIHPSYRNYLIKKYATLINAARLIIDDTYVAQHELLMHLRRYYIGICLYDLNFIKPDDFNYLSTPSGKLFNYYAAGIPVLGTAMVGLNSIEKHQAGALISTINPSNIRQGILHIDYRYEYFAGNAREAAKKFDFRQAFGYFMQQYYKDVSPAETKAENASVVNTRQKSMR